MNNEIERWRKEKETFIYGLLHPDAKPQLKNVRYFGKADNIKRRFTEHLRCAKEGVNTPVYHWIRRLFNRGLKPKVIQIDSCRVSDWPYYEKIYINYFREYSTLELLNVSDGGEAIPINYNQESKRKVAKYDLQGNLIKVYDYVRQITEKDNINFTNVINAIKMGIDGVGYANGYLWMYVQDTPMDRLTVTYVDFQQRNTDRRAEHIKNLRDKWAAINALKPKYCTPLTVTTYYPTSVVGVGMFKRITTTKVLNVPPLPDYRILQLDSVGNVVCEYDTITIAQQILMYRNNMISQCIRGIRQSYKGFTFVKTMKEERKEQINCSPCKINNNLFF